MLRLGFFGLLFLLGTTLVAAAEGGRVSWVYDGDTLQVEGVGRVRLLGIDTPETESSERDDSYRRRGIDRATLRRTAKEAKRYLIRETKGRMVRLAYDGQRHDRYGRTLAYVTLPDGRLLNRELLAAGLGFVYRRFDFRLKRDFLAAEEEARLAGRGVWAGK